MGASEGAGVEGRIDELYAAPPEEFVGRRDALAKELRKAGEAGAAAEVKGLRRPTTAAWAVNQLARRHAGELGELLGLGNRLRAAQENLLSGGGAAGVREAAAERRRLVSALAARAADALGPAGVSHLDDITHTLEAAVADPEQAEVVRRGRLAKELPAPSGFGDLMGFGGTAAPASAEAGTRGPGRSGRPAAAPTAEKEGDDDDRRAAAKAEKAEAERARWSARLERLQADADERAAKARQALKEAAEADQEARRLRRLLETVESNLQAATERAERARAAADRAEEEVRKLRAHRPSG